MIDLRSDTVTKPIPAMRRSMAEAPVGDDMYGDDPSVLALERRTAETLGKEAAVYMPSGTMTNQVALRAHTEAGDEVLADANAHIAVLEWGAPAALSGLTIREVTEAARQHGLKLHLDGARLVEDHVKAKTFAARLERIPGIEIDAAFVETNIVRFRLQGMTAAAFVERCHQAGVHMLPSGIDRVRAVMHLDVSESQVDEALSIIERVVVKDAA